MLSGLTKKKRFGFILAVFIVLTVFGTGELIKAHKYINPNKWDWGEPVLTPGISENPSELQQKLYNFEIFDHVAPTWIPEGFELEKLSDKEDYDKTTVSALYGNGERRFTVYVMRFNDTENMENVRIWRSFANQKLEYGGIRHLISKSINQNAAIWKNGNYLCSIGGGISFEELEGMLKSIYRGA